MTQYQIRIAKDISSLSACFPVFKKLRTHLKDIESFNAQVMTQIQQGYNIAYIKNDANVVACIGYRVFDMLAWGKVLYIDDLITCDTSRGKGYGGALLSYALAEGERLGCDEVHLDTSFTRHDAHRVYLKQGFQLNCHHMALKIKKEIR